MRNRLSVIVFFALVLMLTTGMCESWNDAVSYYDYAWGWVYNGLRGDEDVRESRAFNYAMVQCAADEGKDPLWTTGYTFMDLDGDGTREMIIGQMENQWEMPFLFEIWTHGKTEPVSVLQGWDRNRLYLTNDGKSGKYGFYQEGSDSAFESAWQTGRLQSGRVKWEHVLSYNAEKSSPWTLDRKRVSDAEAEAQIGAWKREIVLPRLIQVSNGLYYE